MKTVVIDNFDSFTYNLVHYIEEICNERPTVLRNNAFQLEDLGIYDCIILSPGPGLPKDAGLLMDVINTYHQSKVILGVCLGHQAICEFFGGTLYNLEKVYHGIDTNMIVKSDQILYGKLDHLSIGRYHSWAVAKDNFPKELEISGEDDNEIIMSAYHKTLPIHGIQYHPESVLTPEGKQLLSNFFDYYNSWQVQNPNNS
jgi:anthranilate synthase component 2